MLIDFKLFLSKSLSIWMFCPCLISYNSSCLHCLLVRLYFLFICNATFYMGILRCCLWTPRLFWQKAQILLLPHSQGQRCQSSPPHPTNHHHHLIDDNMAARCEMWIVCFSACSCRGHSQGQCNKGSLGGTHLTVTMELAAFDPLWLLRPLFRPHFHT